MKRSVPIIGAIIALCSSLGLLMNYTAIIGVFEILTEIPNTSSLQLFADLQTALVLEAVFLIGMTITCFSLFTSVNERRLFPFARHLHTTGGVFLVLASFSLIWGIMDAKNNFQQIASAVTAPTGEMLSDMIQSGNLKMLLGFSLSSVSAVVLFVAFLLPPKPMASDMDYNMPFPIVALFIMAVMVGLSFLLLILSISNNGNALHMLVTGKEVGKIDYWVKHLVGIMNKSVIVYIGFFLLGVAEIWSSLQFRNGYQNLSAHNHIEQSPE